MCESQWMRILASCSCAVLCLVTQLCLTVCDLMDCSPPGSSVLGDSPCKNTGVGCHALFLGIFPTQGSKPRSPALQSDSLPTELRGKPANHKANAQARLQGSEGRVCQQVELWVQHTGQQVMEPTLRHSEGEQQLGRGAEGSSW